MNGRKRGRCEMTTYKGFINLCDTCIKCFGGCMSNPKFLIDKQDSFNEPIPEKYADLVWSCDKYLNKDALRERLATLEHEQWSHWIEYILNYESEYLEWNREKKLKKWVYTEETVEKWRRLMNTKYITLTEKEKDSDREWADKVIEILKEFELI